METNYPYPKTFCPDCGFGIAVDKDGCCFICGAKAIGKAVDVLCEWQKCPVCHGTGILFPAVPNSIVVKAEL